MYAFPKLLEGLRMLCTDVWLEKKQGENHKYIYIFETVMAISSGTEGLIEYRIWNLNIES